MLEHLHAEAGPFGIAPTTLLRLGHTSRTLANLAGDNRYWLPNAPCSALGRPLCAKIDAPEVAHLPFGTLPEPLRPPRLPAELPPGSLRQSYQNRMGQFFDLASLAPKAHELRPSLQAEAHGVGQLWLIYCALRRGNFHKGEVFFLPGKTPILEAIHKLPYSKTPFLFDVACAWLRRDEALHRTTNMAPWVYFDWFWLPRHFDGWQEDALGLLSSTLAQEPALVQRFMSPTQAGQDLFRLPSEWRAACRGPKLWATLLIRLPVAQLVRLTGHAGDTGRRLDLLLLAIYVGGSRLWATLSAQEYAPEAGPTPADGGAPAAAGAAACWRPNQANDWIALRRAVPADSFIWQHAELRRVLQDLRTEEALARYARGRDVALGEAISPSSHDEMGVQPS